MFKTFAGSKHLAFLIFFLVGKGKTWSCAKCIFCCKSRWSSSYGNLICYRDDKNLEAGHDKYREVTAIWFGIAPTKILREVMTDIERVLTEIVRVATNIQKVSINFVREWCIEPCSASLFTRSIFILFSKFQGPWVFSRDSNITRQTLPIEELSAANWGQLSAHAQNQSTFATSYCAVLTSIALIPWATALFFSPFLHRVPKRLLQTTEMLCEFGANVNYSNDVLFGDTPIHFAAVCNNYELIELLFRHKANIHARNHAGYTPLHVAAQNGNEASVTALFLCGADINSTENYCWYTPLHLAVIGQFETVVKALVLYGAKINQSDNCNLTPIDRCQSRKIRNILIGALHPECLNLESSCLRVIRGIVRRVTGIYGFDNLPLPITLRRKLKLMQWTIFISF